MFVTQRGDCEQGYLFPSSPTLASSSVHSQILHGCEIKSGSGLGTRLPQPLVWTFDFYRRAWGLLRLPVGPQVPEFDTICHSRGQEKVISIRSMGDVPRSLSRGTWTHQSYWTTSCTSAQCDLPPRWRLPSLVLRCNPSSSTRKIQGARAMATLFCAMQCTGLVCMSATVLTLWPTFMSYTSSVLLEQPKRTMSAASQVKSVANKFSVYSNCYVVGYTV